MSKKNVKRRRKHLRAKWVPVIVAGVVAVSGVVGMRAFFTDQASITAEAKVGTLKMKVTDLSDLDGNYNSKTDGTEASLLTKEGLQDSNFNMPTATNGAKDKIINPGDDGIYAYQIENIGEKSFDTATVTKVTVSLPVTSSGNVGTGNSGYGGDGATGIPVGVESSSVLSSDPVAYTIPGLGKPGAKTLLADKKTLMYYYVSTSEKPLSGSLEKDGDNTSATYAYTTKFSRDAGNEYQGMTVKIETTIYAKQHRNSPESTLTVNSDGTIKATGDWEKMITIDSGSGDSSGAGDSGDEEPEVG